MHDAVMRRSSVYVSITLDHTDLTPCPDTLPGPAAVQRRKLNGRQHNRLQSLCHVKCLFGLDSQPAQSLPCQ
eukprot:554937-Amphidinium_carterae.1